MSQEPDALDAPSPAGRILVVDDEPRITNFVARALRRRGFDVEEAGAIAPAADLIYRRPYDLVVLDLRLPDGDGVAFLETLVDHHPEVRVLVLSALSDVDTRVRCLRIGAADYLVKPFSISELVARVQARLRDPASVAGDVLRCGDVVLDVRARMATSPDGSAQLSEREFLLLRHLMELGGRVATREELLETIWGIDFDYSSNVVDVYIGRLRTKLGQRSIRTVRNVGYRIQT